MRPRPGSSLVELMLGLTIAAMSLVTLVLVLDGVGATGRLLGREALDAARRQGGDDLVAGLVRRAYVSAADGATFEGDGEHAVFTSWCETAAGWQERCRVRLELTVAGEHPAMRVVTDAGDSLVIEQGRVARLRYRNLPGDTTAWVALWGRGLSAPRAVALADDADTVLYHVEVAR